MAYKIYSCSAFASDSKKGQFVTECETISECEDYANKHFDDDDLYMFIES